jgi:hypothetical protein
VAGAQNLKLEVQTEEGAFRFELTPGQTIIVGRKTDADVCIARTSISMEHLSIKWDGKEVHLADLSSKFGTFRMPQDSPFQKASFPAHYAPLELRLAKSSLKMKWSLPEFRAEATEVVGPTVVRTATGFESERLGPDPLPVLDPGSQASQASLKMSKPTRSAEPAVNAGAKSKSPKPASVPKAASSTAASPASPKVEQAAEPMASESESADRVALAVVGLGFALGGLIISAVAGSRVLGGLLRVPSVWIRTGGIYDVLALWTDFLFGKGALLLLLPFVGMVLLKRMGQEFRAGRRPGLRRLADRLRGVPSGWSVSLRVVSLALWVLVPMWPYAWSLRFGVPVAKWTASRPLARWAALKTTVDTPAADIDRKIESLKALKESFRGSSLLYRGLFDAQRAKVLKECGGVGEAPWENKKVCLVLLFAISVEAREDIRPALLEDVSARATILLSLDGITRVLETEGRNSNMFPFFLESLDMVGLGTEKNDILEVLQSEEPATAAAAPPASAPTANGEAAPASAPAAASEGGEATRETVATLRELRKRIELRLAARQAELGYPAPFRFEVPGPLESGI